jgi:hypothetical protein
MDLGGAWIGSDETPFQKESVHLVNMNKGFLRFGIWGWESAFAGFLKENPWMCIQDITP